MLGSIIDKEAPALPTESCFTPWLGAFLAMCLDKKPEMRPAARDLLKHEWLKPRAPALGASDAGGSHGGSASSRDSARHDRTYGPPHASNDALRLTLLLARGKSGTGAHRVSLTTQARKCGK